MSASSRLQARMGVAAALPGAALPGAALLLLLTSCGSPPPPPPRPAPPAPVEPAAPAAPAALTKEKVDSGLPCAAAEAECDGGYCAVTIACGCEQPITCELAIIANCKSAATLVEAKARSRGTFAAKTEGKLTAAANCAEGEVIRTVVQELKCR
ncbi:MAG: hypothetical protein WKG00_30080 [Polyangiaceae bacterium]